MESNEWSDILSRINSDIKGIIRAQQTLREANSELDERSKVPLEEDFIFTDALDRSPDQPVKRIIEGVTITTRLLHRRGVRQKDILGADILYEIEGKKFVLAQYKTPKTDGRVQLDKEQLDDLITVCPNDCPPYQLSYWPTCASWYAIQSKAESLYLPGCVAKSIFDKSGSQPFDRFSTGISKETFHQLFARCWIGGRISPSEMAFIAWNAMEQDHLLVTILQQGSFGRW